MAGTNLWGRISAWGVAGGVGLFFWGAALGVLSMTPPRYEAARFLFSIGSILIVCSIATNAFHFIKDNHLIIWVITSCIVFGGNAAIWYEAIRWIDGIEKEGRLAMLPTMSSTILVPSKNDHDEKPSPQKIEKPDLSHGQIDAPRTVDNGKLLSAAKKNTALKSRDNTKKMPSAEQAMIDQKDKEKAAQIDRLCFTEKLHFVSERLMEVRPYIPNGSYRLKIKLQHNAAGIPHIIIRINATDEFDLGGVLDLIGEESDLMFRLPTKGFLRPGEYIHEFVLRPSSTENSLTFVLVGRSKFEVLCIDAIDKTGGA